MTTYRGTEPFTGVDAVLAKVLPFLNGTEPQVGEHGLDAQGRVHEWTGTEWHPTGRQMQIEPEAGG